MDLGNDAPRPPHQGDFGCTLPRDRPHS
jgi:hypothetical protein